MNPLAEAECQYSLTLPQVNWCDHDECKGSTMSNREWCPGCESDTSTLKSAFDNGENCPYCGLGNDAWHEIITIRNARDDDEMSLKFAELRIENDRLERELKKAREYAARVKAAVGG